MTLTSYEECISNSEGGGLGATAPHLNVSISSLLLRQTCGTIKIEQEMVIQNSMPIIFLGWIVSELFGVDLLSFFLLGILTLIFIYKLIKQNK